MAYLEPFYTIDVFENSAYKERRETLNTLTECADLSVVKDEIDLIYSQKKVNDFFADKALAETETYLNALAPQAEESAEQSELMSKQKLIILFSREEVERIYTEKSQHFPDGDAETPEENIEEIKQKLKETTQKKKTPKSASTNTKNRDC